MIPGISEITDVIVIDQLCMKKQQLEAQIAKSIYETFNAGAPLHKLQDVARVILKQILKGPDAPLRRAFEKEPHLRLWQKVGRHRLGLSQYTINTNLLRSLDASDCADVIRFAGAWVEEGGLMGAGATGGTTDAWGQDLSISASIKDAFRPGVQTGRGDWRNEVEAVWADGKDRFAGVQTKTRDRGQGWKIEPHLVDLMRDPKAFSGMAGEDSKGAVGAKRAQGESNVLKLDRIFGLVTACDISGTTTDTAFALEVWGGDIVGAGYYMVPFGTIAHNMHHSLLEVALALSINGIIDYRIGFFETMVPAGGLPQELREIGNLVAGAQQRMRNWGLHFMCYFQNNRLAGCYQFSGPAIDRLSASEVSRATTMLDKSLTLSTFPTKAEVEGLVQWVH